MEIDEIRKKASEIERVSDLADLMTQIKRDEFGIKKYPFSSKQLFHYSSSKIVKNRYKTFKIRKKTPGEYREISAPNYELGIILYILNILLKSLFTPRDCVMGFTEGRSVVDNARVHVGHHYVFNIDLKNFFPSISQGRVWARLQYPPFNFPKDVASVIAGLCCNINEEGSCNVLPQGAPTSPILTNAICGKLDYLMLGVAKRFGLHYTRYADDMTFSGMRNIFHDGSEFRKEIERIIEEQGFKMNGDKTRLYRDGQRQEVTGLTVNAKVNTARKYVRDLRCLLHVWEKEGYGKAYAYFYPLYKREKGYIKKGEPVMENVVGGKLNYLRMVKGTNDSTYLRLLERYNRLQQIVFMDKETDEGNNYVYVQPYTLREFEELFNTKVSLLISSRKKLVGMCLLGNTEKKIHISKSTQQKLCSNIDLLSVGDKVLSEKLAKCFITLCRAKGKNFWLITMFEPKRDKCLSVQNVRIDVDKLLDVLEKRGLQEAANLFVDSLCGNYKLSVNAQKKLLVNYLIRCKNMTHIQRKKCNELIARSCIITQECSTVEESTSLKNNGSIDQAVSVDSLKVVSFENGEVIRPISQKQEESNDILDLSDEKEILLRNNYDSDNKNSEVSKEINCISESDDNTNITCTNENGFQFGTRGTTLDSLKYVDPKDMQEFLVDYNQNQILRLTCHTFDNEDDIDMICNTCKTCTYNLRAHSKLIGEEFHKLLGEKEKNKKFLDKKLVSMISVYLTGRDLKGNNRTWSHNIKTTWNDDDFLKWGDENPGIIPSPGNNIIKSQKNKGYTLPEDSQFQTKISKKRTIENFGELVIYFKSLFHIRKDNSMQDILSCLNEKYFNNEEDKAKFTFNEKRQGDDINLFVNVDKLAQAYKRIIDICLDKREEECYEFELSFYEDNCGKILEIYHKNSIYNKSIRNCKRIGKDQESLILNQINGLCNLYVEAEYRDGKSYRLNLWDNEGFKAVQIAPMKGVKYILKF